MAQYEKHWLKVWNERRIFESESVPGRKKSFVTFPFPYMNGPLHIGHCFTASRVDIYARFKRMQGYNVLFPWAWHWTGESIPGMSYRLSQGDEGVRKAFLEIDGVPEKEVERFVDPEYLASYYTRVSREAVKDTGFAIDWRREFRTVDPAFKKFIDWQYQRLRELGYVVQGTHPVVWCSHDESPTGDHDRMEGEGVSPEEFNLLRFEVDEDKAKGSPVLSKKFLVAGTLRPETIFGATNVWVHPHGKYAEADVDGETWIVSLSAVHRLSEQQHKVKVLDEFEGSELLGLTVKAPLTGKRLPVLPATFVDTELVTGVVYSVPAHAPYDYMGLVDVQEGRVKAPPAVVKLARELKPIPLITVPGYSSIPAEDEVKKRGIKDSSDPKLEDATAEVYKAEFHKGVMKENTGELQGPEGQRGQGEGRRGDEGQGHPHHHAGAPAEGRVQVRDEVLRQDTREPVVPELLGPRLEGEDQDPHQGRQRLPRAVARVVLLDDRLAAQLAVRAQVRDGHQAPVGPGVDSRDPFRLHHLHGVLHDLPVRQQRDRQVRAAAP